MPTGATGAYTYSSEPQAVKNGTKAKYRDDNYAPLSLMSDPRVVRGSTQAIARKIIGDKKVNKKALRLKQKQVASEEAAERNARSSYIFDVPGFAGDELDISQYLTDGVDPEARREAMIARTAQTDAFVDKPPTPKYVPRKTGKDAKTQVEDVTELFDFDREVAPMLDVIVGKTLEQALSEVEMEEELRRIAGSIGDFNALRDEELEWMRSREAATKAAEDEKLAALRAKKERVDEQNEVKHKVAGMQMVRQMYPAIFEDIGADLFPVGSFEASTAREGFADGALAEATKRKQLLESAAAVLDEILTEAQDKYHDAVPEYTIPTRPSVTVTVSVEQPPTESDDGPQPSPPIDVSVEVGNHDTIADVEKALHALLAEKDQVSVVVKLSDFIRSTVGRNVARDARLLNFPLPENLAFVISLSQE